MTAEILGRMADRYRIDAVEAILATEREALGSDFGANGYTTRAQADEFVDVLSLEPDRVLLDLGSGCRQPAVDLPVKPDGESLRIGETGKRPFSHLP